jgi:hypothetical protein
MRLRRTSLFTVLVVAAVLLVLAGIVLVSLYFHLRAQPGASGGESQDPWAVAVAGELSAPLALRTLAGEEADVSVVAALSVDDLDTAYATLVFNPSVNDAERSGHLLLLARRYSAEGQQSKATACLRQVQPLLVLSPNLSDMARCDALLQSAKLWQALGNEAAARSNLEQVELIASAPNRLRPAQLRDLWLRLAEAYEALGDTDTAGSARQEADRRRGESGPAAPAPLLPGLLAEPKRPPELEETIGGRRQRAVIVIEQWIALEGGDVGPEVADLAEFMRREDQARQAAYSGVNAEPELAAQAAATWDQTKWLSLKYQAAVGGFGISLVPEWEAAAPTIRSELTKAYETLFLLYGDMATALPSPAQADQAWVELLRQEILFGKLGLYPDLPEEQLVQQLQEAQGRLSLSQPSGLQVTFTVEEGARVYSLGEASRQ